ncbi:hypothetical protein, partial [Streptomyces sp. NPDC059371]|uniref:hypothetical protein n=1 Tax=Streptomyces sp. NPDC059371 TaxID=3346812 RepID=UPI0036757306
MRRPGPAGLDPRRFDPRRFDPRRLHPRRRRGAARPATRRRPGRELIGSPFQLLLLAFSFALAAYAGVRLLADDWTRVALWFVGAAVLHDLVLVPLYAGADRAGAKTLDVRGHRDRTMYVRVPAALSGLLLLVWFPLISGQVADRYRGGSPPPPQRVLSPGVEINAGEVGGYAARGLVGL